MFGYGNPYTLSLYVRVEERLTCYNSTEWDMEKTYKQNVLFTGFMFLNKCIASFM